MFRIETNFISGHFISEYVFVLITFASHNNLVNIGARIMKTLILSTIIPCVHVRVYMCMCICVCAHAQRIQVDAWELQNH